MGKIVKYKVSPFRKDLAIPEGHKLVKLMEGKESKLSLVSIDGEEQTLFSFARRKVDKEEFVRFFTNNIAVQHDLRLAGRRALDVVQWVVQREAIDKDSVHLGAVKLEAWNERKDIRKPISISAWGRGINELIQAGIIARNDNGQLAYYWLNPSILFNGRRQVIVDMIELDEQLIEGESVPNLTADKQKSIDFDQSE